MKKLAIFCEGLTETLFAEELVKAVMGKKALIVNAKGVGKHGQRSLTRITGVERLQPHHEYYVLLVDSGGDGSVASDVLEQYQSLVTRGSYSAIIALRDVYPHGRAHIPALQGAIKRYIPTKPVQVTHVLAVMEVECWFLAEHTHFPRIDAGLTDAVVAAALGLDPAVDDLQTLDNPANDLDRVYSVVGKRYTKAAARIRRTVSALDYDQVYLSLPQRYPPLAQLCGALDNFLM